LLAQSEQALTGFVTLATAVVGGTGLGDGGRGVRVAQMHGTPASVIDGRPQAAPFPFEQKVLGKDAQAFRQAGFRLYSCIEMTSFRDLRWAVTGEFGFGASTMETAEPVCLEVTPAHILITAKPGLEGAARLPSR